MKRKASPRVAPGSVNAFTARTMTRRMRLGMRIFAAFSIPFTPRDTTKSPSPMATRWVRRACQVEWYPFQKASGTAVGISPVRVATKKRIVHPITTE